ncbi:hypothetical protein VTJ04DRAFT_8266 [Mycothermus thermophilus]|uniref:uncharacterized protein n=1 Tax=Humicola insolens TaxID=85995 RepID=UPI003743C703
MEIRDSRQCLEMAEQLHTRVDTCLQAELSSRPASVPIHTHESVRRFLQRGGIRATHCLVPDGGSHEHLNLGLLCVSRLVAAEAAQQFYSINTFHSCIEEEQHWPYRTGMGLRMEPMQKDALRWLQAIGSNAQFIKSAEVRVTPSLSENHTGPKEMESLCQLMPNLRWLDIIL